MNFKDVYKREPIRDLKWVLPFGKWAGTSLEDVIEHDSQYIVWLLNNTDLDFHADIIDRAERTVLDELYDQAFNQTVDKEIRKAFPNNNDWGRD